jgi:hypothetical protein
MRSEMSMSDTIGSRLDRANIELAKELLSVKFSLDVYKIIGFNASRIGQGKRSLAIPNASASSMSRSASQRFTSERSITSCAQCLASIDWPRRPRFRIHQQRERLRASMALNPLPTGQETSVKFLQANDRSWKSI